MKSVVVPSGTQPCSSMTQLDLFDRPNILEEVVLQQIRETPNLGCAPAWMVQCGWQNT